MTKSKIEAKNQRCPECEEPQFMCECEKNFRGEVIKEIYHHANRHSGKSPFLLSMKFNRLVKVNGNYVNLIGG